MEDSQRSGLYRQFSFRIPRILEMLYLNIFQLTCCDTRTEIARFTTVRCHEGLFAGEWKSVLQLNPCSVDIDLIVLTFIIIEKKRRERDGDPIHLTPHDEDPLGDGGGSGEGESGVVGEL